MTRRTDKPLPLPLIAALLALGLWGKDYVAEQGSGRGVEHAGYPNPRIVGSASYEGQPASAAPFNAVKGGDANAEAQQHGRSRSEQLSSDHVAPGAAHPKNADTIWGVDGKGVAYVIEPNPRYPLLRFEMRLPR